jgi:chromosome segregation ATPase
MVKEPFDDMPKFKLDKDDLDSFHRTRAQSNNKTGKSEPLAKETNNSSSSPSWFALLFLLMVIIAVGSFWSFQQFKIFKEAQNRITVLENRLSSTGQDMDQSAAALQFKISELSKKTDDLWEQMDKLWASAWRRNQTEIMALNKTVIALKSTYKKTTRSINSSVSNNDTSIGLLKEQLENQASVINQMKTQLSEFGGSEDEYEQQLASLRERLISTALANNSLTNKIDDLARRVTTAEEAIDESKLPPI